MINYRLFWRKLCFLFGSRKVPIIANIWFDFNPDGSLDIRGARSDRGMILTGNNIICAPDDSVSRVFRVHIGKP